jgi:hypothetical protein
MHNQIINRVNLKNFTNFHLLTLANIGYILTYNKRLKIKFKIKVQKISTTEELINHHILAYYWKSTLMNLIYLD